MKRVVLPVVPAPAARDETKVYADDAWMTDLAQELRQAQTAFLASMVYDGGGGVHGALLARLKTKDRTGFSCTIVVDKLKHQNGTVKLQALRLKELARLGAAVKLATGIRNREVFGKLAAEGVMHRKGAFLDGKVLYMGSANLTQSSRGNLELMLRMEGEVAKRAGRMLQGCAAGALAFK